MTITHHDTYCIDENGNRADYAYWRFGDAAKAEASLTGLKNCKACTNCSVCSVCSGCSGCSDCSDCSGCSVCSDCSDCSRCSGCSRCSRCSGCSQIQHCAGKPRVVGPVRSDGYQFVMGPTRSIHAGCRVFDTMAVARTHWTETRGGTALGDETALILDYLEASDKLRNPTAE